MEKMTGIRSYPFVKQSLTNSCGAACLAMVYKYLGLVIDEKTIFDSILGANDMGGQNCRSYLMCQDALKRGFEATIFSAKDIKSTINLCRDSDVELIILYHKDSGSLTAHFSVVSDVVSGSVYIKDPLSDVDTDVRIRFLNLFDLARTSHILGDDIIHDNTVIAISKKETPIVFVPCNNDACKMQVPIIDSIAPQVETLFCPYCDHVVNIQYPFV